MKLIGLSGTNGAGKDSVAEILRDKHSYLFVSVSDLLRDEAKSRGLDTERTHLRTISAEWRREHGLGVLVKKAIELYDTKNTDDRYRGLVVSSIRNPGEVDELHKHGGKVIWVDADARVRYDRIHSRGREDDKKSFEQFKEEERAEMQHSGDSATLSMMDVKEETDDIIINNSSNFDDLDEVVRYTLGTNL